MPLADNARQYHDDIVTPNIAALAADPDSKVASANAVTTMTHMMDWVYNEKPPAYWAEVFPPGVVNSQQVPIKASFRNGVEQLHPGLVTLRDFANGVKHADMTADLLINLTWDECDFTWGQAQFTYDDAGSKALLHPGNSTAPVQTVEDAVNEADAFWLGFMQQHGI